MRFLRPVPAVLSLAILAAHFLRQGQQLLVVLAVVVAGLLAVPRRWARRTVQVALLLGALEWLRTMVVLSLARSEMGMPATRMIIILAGVALLAVASSLALERRSVTK